LINKTKNTEGKFVTSISNIFKKTEQFIKSGGIRTIFLEQFKQEFDKIEKDIESFLSHKQTLKYLVEQVENTEDVEETEKYLEVLMASQFQNHLNPKHHNRVLSYLNQGSDYPIDLRELRHLLILGLFQLSYNLKEDKFNITYLTENDSDSLVTTVNTLHFSKRNSEPPYYNIPSFYLLNLLKYLTTETGTEEFTEVEEKLFSELEENLLENLKKTLNVFKKNVTNNSTHKLIHCEYKKGVFKDIPIPLELFKTRESISFLEENFIYKLFEIQHDNHYTYEEEMKFDLSELRNSYQKLFEEDFAQYYLKLIDDSNLCQLTNSQFVRFFKLLHSTVTVTEETYSEVVAEVKEFLYKENSPYKMIQPFTSQLSIFDIFEEKDLVNILSSCIKTLERRFVVTNFKGKSEFVKEINLRDVSLSFDLMSNDESDSSFIISSEEIKEIFKRFKQFNFEESELIFYLNPFNSNDYTEEIVKGNFDDELEGKGFTYLKQLQKLVQTHSSEKNLNQMYIDEDSDIKTVTIENVKFFRKLFSELPVDEYFVPNQELADILQEFYLIPKDNIKLVVEDYSENCYSFRMTQFKKQQLKEIVSELVSYSPEIN
jgi:hypothetical protein